MQIKMPRRRDRQPSPVFSRATCTSMYTYIRRHSRVFLFIIFHVLVILFRNPGASWTGWTYMQSKIEIPYIQVLKKNFQKNTWKNNCVLAVSSRMAVAALFCIIYNRYALQTGHRFRLVNLNKMCVGIWFNYHLSCLCRRFQAIHEI